MKSNDINIGLWIVSFVISILFGFTLVAFALSEADVTFPVAELGNCENKEACKAYCNEEEHFADCIAFAKKHNLLGKRELERAEKVTSLPGGRGPGECKGMNECRAYCENPNNLDECIEFAREHGLMEGEELEEAEKVARALRQGARLPGGCTSKVECEAYCHEEGHMDECLEFGRAAGFMTEEEYQIAKRTGGRGPGGCRGRECQDYCEDESHFEECLAFGKEHGLISDEEYEIAKKTGGRGPGGCRRDECRDYCDNPDHFEECLAFGREHGLISDEEYEIVRKTGGQGPGGCRGEECRRYCEDAAHQEECVAFAREHGLISEEEVGRMEEHRGRLKGMLNEAPPEVITCLRERLGTNLVEKMRSGEIQPGPEIGEKVRACFEQYRPPAREGRGFPPEVEACMREAFGPDFQERLERGEIEPGPEVEAKIKACFERFEGQGAPPGEGDHTRPEDFSEGEVNREIQERYEQERREEFEHRRELELQREHEELEQDRELQKLPERVPPNYREFPNGTQPPIEVQPVPPVEGEIHQEPSVEPEARLRLFGAILLQALEILVGR